jgi:signal transduction histidine kinase/CheY-like chemotaxis protein
MNEGRHRLSRSSQIVIVICLVVLSAIFLLNYLNVKNISTLQDSFSDLSKEDTGLNLLRESRENLAKAEDHYRIYINSWDASEKIRYLENMDSAINNLKSFNALDTEFSQKIYRDVNFKLNIYSAITDLKKLADSGILQNPLFINEYTFNNEPVKLDRLNSSFFKNYFFRSTDTLQLISKRKKKNFFKKLGELFFNRDDEVVNKEFKKGAPDEKTHADSIQKHHIDSIMNGLSSHIRNYYHKSINEQMNIRKQLSDKETALAQKNLAIIYETDSKINDLLQTAIAAGDTAKQNSRLQAEAAHSSLIRISIFSLLSIIVLIGLLIYNIYRTNKYEEAIITAKTSAEKLAVLKSRFLSNMSHEIRSPLTSIIGFTEQIAQNEKNEKNSRYLDAIKVSSGHLLNTVNDVLDFSKLDAGKLRLDKEPFLLQKAIDEVAFAFSLEAAKKNISINVRSEIDKKFCVTGDAFRFKQILYNLIINAIKFTDKGSVEIIANTTTTANNKNTTATIAVHDTGMGIAPNQLDFIFQEFTQAALTRKSDTLRYIRGTGLGLPICKMLAELQGGNIKVQSTPGKGSIFTVRVPYEIAEMSDVKIDNILTEEKTQTQINLNKKILVVEDNELNIMLIALLLERMGYAFDVANDGEQALQLFKEKDYNLILTDINIPKLTGIQLAEIFRKDNSKQKASLPIVALTADTISEDFETYYKAGINKIIVKPFQENEFRSVVEQYINITGLQTG